MGKVMLEGQYKKYTILSVTQWVTAQILNDVDDDDDDDDDDRGCI
jgi:hypothetical protein